MVGANRTIGPVRHADEIKPAKVMAEMRKSAEDKLENEIDISARLIASSMDKISFATPLPSMKDGVLIVNIEVLRNPVNYAVFNSLVEQAERTVNALCDAIGLSHVSNSDYNIRLIKKADAPDSDFVADMDNGGKIVQVEDIINGRRIRGLPLLISTDKLQEELEGLQRARPGGGTGSFVHLMRAYHLIDTYAVLLHEMLHAVEKKHQLNGFVKKSHKRNDIQKLADKEDEKELTKDNEHYAEKFTKEKVLSEGFTSFGEGVLITRIVSAISDLQPDSRFSKLLKFGIFYVSTQPLDAGIRWLNNEIIGRGELARQPPLKDAWKKRFERMLDPIDSSFDPYVAGMRLACILYVANGADPIKTLKQISEMERTDDLRNAAVNKLVATFS